MDRDQIGALFYGRPEHQRRFTQDFPILPDGVPLLPPSLCVLHFRSPRGGNGR